MKNKKGIENMIKLIIIAILILIIGLMLYYSSFQIIKETIQKVFSGS